MIIIWLDVSQSMVPSKSSISPRYHRQRHHHLMGFVKSNNLVKLSGTTADQGLINQKSCFFKFRAYQVQSGYRDTSALRRLLRRLLFHFPAFPSTLFVVVLCSVLVLTCIR